MKRTFLLAFACLVISLPCLGQGAVSLDMLQRNMNTSVALTLKDAKTSEPITWASVYLIPHGDTTITHFSLSDDNGDVLIKDVPVGKYEVNAEIIGYLPYRKVHTFKNWKEDLGIIKMEENAEFLEAAKVSATGNAIMVKQDTIIYNASSFKIGENDVLADLLKKMPGIEIGSDGSVTVNGEQVSEITVGGKTFFFDDPSAALKNLPAKIVDKIKVIDKDKDEAEFSGISTKDDKETVMDVELKEEYTKGWFGNAKLGGGSTLTPESDIELTDDRKLLYNGNMMVSGYTEKDQVVFIGNAYNATEPGANMVIMYGAGDDDDGFSSLDGLNSSAQAGVNYSTERIKGFEGTLAVNYKNNAKEARNRSSRTSYQNDGNDIYSDGEFSGFGNENSISVNLEIENKDKDKYMLYFSPMFKFSDNRLNSTDFSRTYTSDKELNNLTTTVDSRNRNFATFGWMSGGIKDLGKKRRSITLGLEYNFNESAGHKNEVSLQSLNYDINNGNSGVNVSLTYVEPIGEKWAVQALLASRYSDTKNSKDAFNPDGSANTNYTSSSDVRYLQERVRLLTEYKNDPLTLQVGLLGDISNTLNRSTSMGKESIIGKGDWLFNWSPFATLRYKKDSHRLNLYYNGFSNEPSSRYLTPALDISDPLQITAGNIYLRPGYTSYLSSSYSTNDRETFSFLNVNLHGSMDTGGMVYASWFDEGGVRYAVPVNATKPGATASLYLSYNVPIGKKRLFTFSISGNGTFSSNTSYQAKTRLPGIDMNNFDYESFMTGFWGDASGNRFYSGESGFMESQTNTWNWRIRPSLKFTVDKLEAAVSAGTSNRISLYSLNKEANMNTWDSEVGCNVLYTPGKEWEISTDLKYIFYHGYSSGYGRPEWNWNMKISKTFKSVTLSILAVDILNQNRDLRRTTSDEYMEDVHSLILGRHIMGSISFNFGKMNAKKNSNVENAMWRGMW